MVYTQPDHRPPSDFLAQELSHLLLFISYMFQSGRYPRVTKAAQDIADKVGKGNIQF
jgi:hypothetical protein